MQEWLLYLGVPTILGVILYAIIQAGVQAPGHALAQKFAELGNLQGRTLDEIQEAVGPPNSFSTIGENQVLYEWLEAGYHIALVFTNDKCDGVHHESLV